MGWSVRCGIALLEAVWAVQGLCCRCRWLYLPPEQAGQAGHSMGLSLPPASGCSKASQFPLQSFQHSLHRAGGGRTDLPQPKLQRKARAGAFIAGTLSGREEQG